MTQDLVRLLEGVWLITIVASCSGGSSPSTAPDPGERTGSVGAEGALEEARGPLDALASLTPDSTAVLEVEEWARWPGTACALASTETRIALGYCLEQQVDVYVQHEGAWIQEASLREDVDHFGEWVAIDDEALGRAGQAVPSGHRTARRCWVGASP